VVFSDFEETTFYSLSLLKNNKQSKWLFDQFFLFLKITYIMKKTEKLFAIYNQDESTMYGSFQDRESAQRWKDKITPVVSDDLKIKESTIVMELPEGISFSNEIEGFILNGNMTPMQNMAGFIEWSYNELKQNLNKNYEGMVALEIVKAMLQMSKVLKQSENKSLDEMDSKLRKSHQRFLEAGKIAGIEFMLKYTYDYWRNQEEKDFLIEHYYSKMKKEK